MLNGRWRALEDPRQTIAVGLCPAFGSMGITFGKSDSQTGKGDPEEGAGVHYDEKYGPARVGALRIFTAAPRIRCCDVCLDGDGSCRVFVDL